MDTNQLSTVITALLSATQPQPSGETRTDFTGKHVIVRCRDAGVHAGYLQWRDGRSCGLKDARRLWYWKPANGSAFLSGVAEHGLHEDSKVGCKVDIELTEDCEIIRTSTKAELSITSVPDHQP